MIRCRNQPGFSRTQTEFEFLNLLHPKKTIMVTLIICIFSLTKLQAQETELTYRNVRILFELNDEMFPKYWLKKPYSISAKSVQNSERERSIKLLKKALDRFPKELLGKHLSRVYVVSELRFSGIEAGGTYWNDRLYLVNDGERMGYTDRYLLEAFNHEFSSIFYHKYHSSFRIKEWKAANEKDFKYSGSGTDSIKEGKDSLFFERQLGERGFINQYGLSSVEEDFNTISARLFTADESFHRIYKKYERLRKKIDLAIGFYETIDPALNKSFFLGEHKE